MLQIDITQTGYGHWRISMLYRGKRLYATTTNSMAIDRYNSDEPRTRNAFYNSQLQACKALKATILRANGF